LNHVGPAPVYFHAELVLAGRNGKLTGFAPFDFAQFGPIQHDGIRPEIVREFVGSSDSQNGHAQALDGTTQITIASSIADTINLEDDAGQLF